MCVNVKLINRLTDAETGLTFGSLALRHSKQNNAIKKKNE